MEYPVYYYARRRVDREPIFCLRIHEKQDIEFPHEMFTFIRRIYDFEQVSRAEVETMVEICELLVIDPSDIGAMLIGSLEWETKGDYL